MNAVRMTVRNAPPGLLLLTDGNVVFKTEYHDGVPPHERPISYVVRSGERYHGEGDDVECADITDGALTMLDTLVAVSETVTTLASTVQETSK